MGRLEDEERRYFAAWYRLDHREGTLLWYSGNGDGVVVDAGGFVPAFHDVGELRAYAGRIGVTVENESPLLQDLDPVRRWLKRPRRAALNCDAVLCAWNLFDDVARSVHHWNRLFPYARRTLGLYDRVFRGNNLPAMTPPGEHFEPHWTASEARKIANVLANGFHVFRRRVRGIG